MNVRNLIQMPLLLAVIFPCASHAQSLPAPAAAARSYGKLPLTFEANQGQVSGQVKYLSRGSDYSVFLTSKAMVLAINPSSSPQPSAPTAARAKQQTRPAAQPAHTITFTLVDASPTAIAVGENVQPGKANYFIGNDPSKWRTNIPTYGRVRYKNVYAGIDLVYYGNQRQVEYDFVVAGGADPGQIKFQISGADQLRIDDAGDLVLKVGSGELKFQAPAIYQESHGQRTAISGRYRVDGNEQIVFEVDKHDGSKPLVIDPVLVYSTYLGGRSSDQVQAIGLDSIGNLYLAGNTNSPDFPLAVGTAVPSTNTNPMFVAKLDVSGSNLLYADYIAGSVADSPQSIQVTTAGTVYITGTTESPDFPTVNPFQLKLSGYEDVFISELSPDGATLQYSTYLGGSSGQNPVGIGLGPNGEILVAGSTSSADFPVANAVQSTFPAAPADTQAPLAAFMTELTADGSALTYSTFLSGTTFPGETECFEQCSLYTAPIGFAVDASGNAYIAGDTDNSDYPTTSGAYITTFPVTTSSYASASFVTKLSSAGKLSYSTYFGVPGSTYTATGLSSMALDAAGEAYILGYYGSAASFPQVGAGVCNTQNTALCTSTFLTKFSADGSSLVLSTLLPLNPSASFSQVALDSNANIFLTGSYYVQNLSTNPGLIDPIEGASGSSEVLLSELDPAAATQPFLTLLGGTQSENLSAMAIDSTGAVYLAGSTSSSDFPVTEASYQQTNAGSPDIFVSKIDMNTAAPAVAIAPSLLQYSIRNVGTAGQQKSVLLRNMGTAPLLISSATISGDFAQTNTCGTSVPAGGTCTFAVTFNPIAPGSLFGTILIEDNAVGSPHFINLSGVGSTPVVQLSAASLTFASLQVNSTSKAQSVTLTNQGNATLNVGSIVATGDFAQTNNCPASVALGAGCQILVTFTPTAGGALTGAITITDNAADSPETIVLTGSGYTTTATVSPSTLQFASTQAATTTAAQTVKITNTGANAMQMYGVTVSANFTQTNNCSSIAPQASCSVNVTFSPKASGILTGSLSLNDNASGNPQLIALTGTGVAPVVSIAPASLTFATQDAGAVTTQKLTITNQGNAPLSFSKIQMQGDYSQTNNCTAVAASASCTVNVSFDPTSSGTLAGSITFTDTAATSPQIVLLSGVGVAAQVTLSPAALKFMGAPIGTMSSAQAVTVTNSGTAAMTIASIQATGNFAETNNCGSSLAEAASCTVMVTFDPQAAGAQTGTLTLNGNAVNSGVALTGSGADFALTASTSTASAAPGSSATYALSVASVGADFTSPVLLTCSGVPVGSTCTLAPASVTPGGTAVPVTVTVTTVAVSVAGALPASRARALGLWLLRAHGLGLAVLLLFFRRGRVHRGMWLAVLAPLLVGTLMLAGCSGGHNSPAASAAGGTPAGTYQLTVFGTAGTTQHSTGLTLKVQ